MGLMTLFSEDLNKTVILQKQKGKNYAGIIEYETKEILARIDGIRRFVQNEKGASKYSQQTYITLEEVSEGDRIDGQFVFSVNILYDFDGSILHYEASL